MLEEVGVVIEYGRFINEKRILFGFWIIEEYLWEWKFFFISILVFCVVCELLFVFVIGGNWFVSWVVEGYFGYNFGILIYNV